MLGSMGNLNALFFNVAEFKNDLVTYGVIAAGAIAGPVALNLVLDKVFEVTKLRENPTVAQYGKPLAMLVAGILAGNLVMRRAPLGMHSRNLGMGIAVGCTALALGQLVGPLLPVNMAATLGLPTKSYAALPPSVPQDAPAGYLRGAVVEVEEVNGAPISVENVAGLSANFAATIS